MSKVLKYRPDLDGIRALAVLSVIVFHIDPQWLPGGFLGVDMFFVLSGYLITTIISREIRDGSFSFLEFTNAAPNVSCPFCLRIALHDGRCRHFLFVFRFAPIRQIRRLCLAVCCQSVFCAPWRLF